MTDERDWLAAQVEKYVWYHTIEVADGVKTISADGGYDPVWDFIRAHMAAVDFAGKRVLDVGCRDGMFSFEAERRGAAEIIGIDNDISTGAVEFLIPHFGSKVRMEQLNLYELHPEGFGEFDIILFFGVLYHLRYPFWGLRKLTDCLKSGGDLLIESGMLVDNQDTEKLDLLMCPVENSPYEETSCTFFNRQGLITTLRSFGLEPVSHESLMLEGQSKDRKYLVNRQFIHFRKVGISEKKTHRARYWDRTHELHTVVAAARLGKGGKS